MASKYRVVWTTLDEIKDWSSALEDSEIDLFAPWGDRCALDIYLNWAATIGWRFRSLCVSPMDRAVLTIVFEGESFVDPNPKVDP